MLKVYKIIIPLLLLTLVESCGGGENDYGYNYTYYYYYKLNLIDTNDVIKEISFAPLSNGMTKPTITPNSRFADWKISSILDQTVMYITTFNRTDTLVIRSKSNINYQSGVVNFEKSTPQILYSSFDTTYILSTQSTNNYSYYSTDITYTLFFRLK